MASQPQVLVVGAGPTGLFMAAELGRQGVPCRIVDRNPGPSGQSRATSLQPRTLEVLDAVELVDTFVASAVVCHTIGTYTPDMKVLHRVSNDELDSPFPFVLSLPQSKTEELLTRHLAGFGTSVDWSGELRSFVQDEDGVTAVLRRAGGREETVRVPYLVGCDGAHSTVRHTLGVAFAGTDYPTDFAVADVRLEWGAAIPTNEICFFVGPEGQLFYTPFVGGAVSSPATSGETPASIPRPANRPWRNCRRWWIGAVRGVSSAIPAGVPIFGPTSVRPSATTSGACSWPATRHTSSHPRAGKA